IHASCAPLVTLSAPTCWLDRSHYRNPIDAFAPHPYQTPVAVTSSVRVRAQPQETTGFHSAQHVFARGRAGQPIDESNPVQAAGSLRYSRSNRLSLFDSSSRPRGTHRCHPQPPAPGTNIAVAFVCECVSPE